MSEYKIAREEISRFIGVDLKIITYVLYKTRIENSYSSFEIPKKNGETRLISTPNDRLKYIQRKLGEKLYDMHKNYLISRGIRSDISHGFEKNKSIITNAYSHRNKRYLLNVDISNFFSSFNFGRVRGYFHKSKEFRFSEEFATILAQLVCYKGELPQGAPTSPLISNLIFYIIDLKILVLAKKYKLNYTRYADDMSFSTNKKTFKDEYLNFIQELSSILKSNGFEINENKTRLEYFSSRQEVTGLTVNKKLNVDKIFIKKTRAMANRLYKTNTFQIDGEDGTLNQLEGRLSFINQLDWTNNKLEYKINKKQYNKKFISKLNSREKQYQYFLFYKYFYNPDKLTIVTEGKTDILHIKAALMKNSDTFPKLITKKENEEFEFNVRFLNRTKRLNYFLGISGYGADSMKNIWNFYTGSNNFFNIYEYINNKNQTDTLNKINPVILLFDNEQKSDRPLNKFLNYTKLKLEEDTIQETLKANLYLQTVPLVKGLNECEIEDLYPDKVLKTKIHGKTFSRSKGFDSTKYYGKYEFSKYIINHYQEIDFSNFIVILESINSLI